MGEDVVPVAGRPTLTNHPVIGGDALCFPIVPKPPRLWWIHFRSHLHPNPVIKRPWDQEAESSLIVECPSAATLESVLDAVDDAVRLSNLDYAEDLVLAVSEQKQRQTDSERHAQELEELQTMIAKRYPAG